jgi:hypothetical protein
MTFSTGARDFHATGELYTGELHTPSLYSPKQEGDVALKLHVASFKCFRYFRGTLQVFRMSVAKVDRDIAYVAMVVHVYCKRLFSNISSVF